MFRLFFSRGIPKMGFYYQQLPFNFGVFVSKEDLGGFTEANGEIFLRFIDGEYTISENGDIDMRTPLFCDGTYVDGDNKIVVVDEDNWKKVLIQAMAVEYNLPKSFLRYTIDNLGMHPVNIKNLMGNFEETDVSFGMTSEDINNAMSDLNMYERVYSGGGTFTETSGILVKYLYNISNNGDVKKNQLILDEQRDVLEFIETNVVSHFLSNEYMIEERVWPENDLVKYNKYISKLLPGYSSDDATSTGYIIRNQGSFDDFILECLVQYTTVGLSGLKYLQNIYKGTYDYYGIRKVFNDISLYFNKLNLNDEPAIPVKTMLNYTNYLTYVSNSRVVNILDKNNNIVIEEENTTTVFKDDAFQTKQKRYLMSENDPSYTFLENTIYFFNVKKYSIIADIFKFYVFGDTVIYMTTSGNVFMYYEDKFTMVSIGVDMFCTIDYIFVRSDKVYKYDMNLTMISIFDYASTALADYTYSIKEDKIVIYSNDKVLISIKEKSNYIFPVLNNIYITNDNKIKKISIETGEIECMYTVEDTLIGVYASHPYVIGWSKYKAFIFNETNNEIKQKVTSRGPTVKNLSFNGNGFISVGHADNDYNYIFIGNSVYHSGVLVYTHHIDIYRLYIGSFVYVLDVNNNLHISVINVNRMVSGDILFDGINYYDVSRTSIKKFYGDNLLFEITVKNTNVVVENNSIFVFDGEYMYTYQGDILESKVPFNLTTGSAVSVFNGKIFYTNKGSIITPDGAVISTGIKGNIYSMKIDGNYIIVCSDSGEYIAYHLLEYLPPGIFSYSYSNVNPLFPEKIDEIIVVSQLPGSTGAQLVQDRLGRRFVMKKAKGTAIKHLTEECTANVIYRKSGILVPEEQLYWQNNTLIRLSRFYESTPFTGKGITASILRNGFVVDAFLSNWDVIGMGMDNILVVNGHPVRIDNGGALRFRAQGEDKGSRFTNMVLELSTMRCRGFNFEISKECEIFKPITLNEIRVQIDYYLPFLTQIVNELKGYIDAELFNSLHARLDYLSKFDEEMFYITQYVAGRYLRNDRLISNTPIITLKSIMPSNKEYILYRGFSSDNIEDMRQWYNQEINLPVLNLGDNFKLRSRYTTSWSISIATSRTFSTGKYSMVLYTTAKKDDVLVDLRKENSVESEVILKPGTLNVQVIELRLNGFAVGSTMDWDREVDIE